MATYVVGDVQGCLAPLKALLDQVSFNRNDELWLAGDLVNRGPHSLEVLRFVQSLGPQAIVVLGNHDLHLLALYSGQTTHRIDSTLQPVFDAEDHHELMAWLACQPLLHYDQTLQTVMTHAGVPPCWDLVTAQACAQEVHQVLRSGKARQFYATMYGNLPNLWHDDLTGSERWRCITNYLTRMRFLYADYGLELSTKGHPANFQPDTKKKPDIAPWFTFPSKIPCRQVFGHWAALDGETGVNNIINLDMGCVWGGQLKMLCLDDDKVYTCCCA